MTNEPNQSPQLMTDADVVRVHTRQLRVMMRGVLVGLPLCIAFVSLVHWVMDHALLPSYENVFVAIAFLASVLVAVTIFVLPLLLAYRKSKSIVLLCPQCNADITAWYFQLFKTRCCCMCGERILAGGKAHSNEAYRRYWPTLQKRQNRFYLLGAWLVLIPWLLVCMYAPIIRDRPELLAFVGTFGIARAVWLALKDGNRTQLPLLPMYGLVLCIGLWRWI